MASEDMSLIQERAKANGAACTAASVDAPASRSSVTELRELMLMLLCDESSAEALHAARSYVDRIIAEAMQCTHASACLSLSELDVGVDLLPVDAGALDLNDLATHLQPWLRTEASWLPALAASSLASTAAAAMLWPLYRDCLTRSVTQGMIYTIPCIPEQRDSTLFDQPNMRPIVFQLALGRFVHAYLPEIFGYSLGYAQVMTSLRHGLPAVFDDVEESPLTTGAAECCIRQALEFYLQTQDVADVDAVWRRCCVAALIARQFVTTLFDKVKRNCARPAITSRTLMLQLLWRKSTYARGHHRDHCLAGVRLETWFAHPEQTGELLDALAASTWVNRECPLESRLLTELMAFRGPMFQVFTADEVGVVKSWLMSLAIEDASAATEPVSLPAPTAVQRFALLSLKKPVPTRERLTVRSVFQQLILFENYPDILDQSKVLVESWMLRATRLQRWRGDFKHADFAFTEAGFAARIEAIYKNAVDSYQPLRGKPWLRRPEYRWLLLQLAPLFLVDGCWLQRVGTLVHGYPELVPGLLAILSDEIGNGKTAENHANVYLKLLRGEGIELPELHSEAFSQSTAIETCAFELPVFMLSMSLHLRTCLPELLGLNLAIELSGLGGFYMRLVDELRFYQFDPTIISLHLSIDNLATGHAALARDLIPLYLQKVRLQQGEAEMQRHWCRIWTGYLSISYYSQRLLLRLAPAFLRNFGRERLRSLLAWRPS